MADMGVTANAILLLGFVAGLIERDREPTYRVEDVDPTADRVTLRHVRSGNLHRLLVVQLEGVE